MGIFFGNERKIGCEFGGRLDGQLGQPYVAALSQRLKGVLKVGIWGGRELGKVT